MEEERVVADRASSRWGSSLTVSSRGLITHVQPFLLIFFLLLGWETNNQAVLMTSK